MFNKINDIVKSIKGNVLLIEVDDKLINYFDKNNEVNLYSISKDKNPKIIKKTNKMISNNGKSINIKKLKKYFKYKSIDYLIINMDEVIDYYKYIIKDTISINNNKIYIYSSNKIDKNFIIERYNRYNTLINIFEYKNGYLISINNNDTKYNFFKNKIYFIKDTLYNLAELIGNILAS